MMFSISKVSDLIYLLQGSQLYWAFPLGKGSLVVPSTLGNCDIHAEGKILYTNEMKQNKIWSRPKGYVQKIFWTLPQNFGNGHNKSC